MTDRVAREKVEGRRMWKLFSRRDGSRLCTRQYPSFSMCTFQVPYCLAKLGLARPSQMLHLEEPITVLPGHAKHSARSMADTNLCSSRAYGSKDSWVKPRRLNLAEMGNVAGAIPAPATEGNPSKTGCVKMVNKNARRCWIYRFNPDCSRPLV